MNNLIEKLKNNKVAFGLMEKEEQECFRKVKRVNCQFISYSGIWKDTDDGDSDFSYNYTYRIRPDFKEENGERKLAVTIDCNFELIFETHLFVKPLYKAIDLLNFKCFEYENGERSLEPRKTIHLNEKAIWPKYVVLEVE